MTVDTEAVTLKCIDFTDPELLDVNPYCHRKALFGVFSPQYLVKMFVYQLYGIHLFYMLSCYLALNSRCCVFKSDLFCFKCIVYRNFGFLYN